jgi:hypothetical protein
MNQLSKWLIALRNQLKKQLKLQQLQQQLQLYRICVLSGNYNI